VRESARAERARIAMRGGMRFPRGLFSELAVERFYDPRVPGDYTVSLKGIQSNG
jgi:hypothetical protein